jgi:hypothetical protein
MVPQKHAEFGVRPDTLTIPELEQSKVAVLNTLASVHPRRSYVAAASDPKKVLYYDTGHDLNDPHALEDRYDWLVKYIDVRRERVLTR